MAIITLVTPIIVWAHYLLINYFERKAMAELSILLHPDCKESLRKDIHEFNRITHGRFNELQLLDYYLKIKGLQIVDLHTSSSSHVRNYLMKPTKIKLNYSETVIFYEKFLNMPQASGLDATCSFDL
ncbi:MAG: hypothetical protein Q4C30_04505 [Bacteroidia bacterium]|nr:hypothetical protein [Bacteroidia bacterium]